jgi:hypothetical protein
LALKFHDTGIRLDDPGHDLNQGGFSCAILAENSMDSATETGEVRVFERPDTAVALRNSIHEE